MKHIMAECTILLFVLYPSLIKNQCMQIPRWCRVTLQMGPSKCTGSTTPCVKEGAEAYTQTVLPLMAFATREGSSANVVGFIGSFTLIEEKKKMMKSKVHWFMYTNGGGRKVVTRRGSKMMA